MSSKVTLDICAFEKLLKRNVPHILETIFFFLDLESFVNCRKVNKEWNRLLTSETYKVKCRTVFQREMCMKVSAAIRVNSLATVKRLLDTKMVDVNFTGKVSNTWQDYLAPPLFEAIYSHEIDMVTCLLENGADPNTAFSNGHTALMSAVSIHGAEVHKIVRALLNKGADPNKVDIGYGRSALHIAVKVRRNLDKVRLLIEAGADPNLKSRNGVTPLFFPQLAGWTEMIDIMLTNRNT